MALNHLGLSALQEAEVVLGQIIGQGSFGRVFRAQWRGSPVAVKSIETRRGPPGDDRHRGSPGSPIAASEGHRAGTGLQNSSRSVGAVGEQLDTFDGIYLILCFLATQSCNAVFYCARGPNSAADLRHLVGEQRDFLDEFERETAFLRNLRHPNVLQFLGWYAGKAGELCIVTELCAASLDRLLHKSSSVISPLLSVGMALDAARGLCYLHAQNVVHRDVKSANLLLVDLRSCRLKVADFGLAQTLTAKGNAKTSSRVGTVLYDAPEVLRGGLADKRSDCYSLGAGPHDMDYSPNRWP